MRGGERLLLDTCAVIWLSQADLLSDAAMAAINAVPPAGNRLLVSVMTAWEIGMLVSKGRVNATRPPLQWFNEFVARSSVAVIGVDASVLVMSSYLPGSVHNDPIDRMIIATAREHDLTVVTRDKAILAYGAAGHVRTLAC